MRVTRQDLVRLFRAFDRALGGEHSPTRFQRFGARRPLLGGVLAATPLAIFFLLIVLWTGGSPSNMAMAVGIGWLLAPGFYATLVLERRRQSRLQRLGRQVGPGRHAAQGPGRSKNAGRRRNSAGLE